VGGIRSRRITEQNAATLEKTRSVKNENKEKRSGNE
jgi:hypothetical protein